MARRLVRKNALLAGVCGGIADSFGWNPTLVRILYVVISTLSAAIPGILIYIVLWLLIPKDE
jgi:phage shock protein PspC (stress-responsive transcriptional regulator)